MPPNNIKRVDRLIDILVNGYDQYFDAFADITRRAQHRFEASDWSGMRKDTVERLDLYPLAVAQTVDAITHSLGAHALEQNLWKAAKAQYSRQALDRRDAELTATFFNSVNRKVFNAVEFDPELTFIDLPATAKDPLPVPELMTAQGTAKISAATIQTMIAEYGFQVPFADLEHNAGFCADRINAIAGGAVDTGQTIHIELLKSPFFRGMSAYLVGQFTCGNNRYPLVLALNNSSRGLYIDALLSKPEEIRIMFSFARAYFQVATKNPSALAAYLKQLMPAKRLAEIYIALGFHKHGKTELYRDLIKHQDVCGEDQFDFSPGKHGMVMIAFNMPGDDLIYKLIRDRFDSPKKTTATQVMEKYDYVFKHDRAGRLVDVQTFEHLKLDECCFTPQLIQEIKSEAKHAASIVNGLVVLHHAYVERRVTPLDVYLQTAGPADAAAAIIDFGQAIKDLAHVNVFPGDMLIKNFGLTNMGRVVFYDYDELCPLTVCNFRRLPQARYYDDEMSAEPWYTVGEHDVFSRRICFFSGVAARTSPDFSGPSWRSARTRILANGPTPDSNRRMAPYPALWPPSEVSLQQQRKGPWLTMQNHLLPYKTTAARASVTCPAKLSHISTLLIWRAA